jgi:AcrR family transcriptional regulator
VPVSNAAQNRHTPGRTNVRGRPRDAGLDDALISAAEQQLRTRGYARTSLKSVADAAGTTVPSLLRRYPDKAALAVAVVDSLRIEPLTVPVGEPRDQALAVLVNFNTNLQRPNSMGLLATLLVEEHQTPQLLEHFRVRLSAPRRQLLRQILAAGISTGALAAHVDPDTAADMLIGSFYARYVSNGSIPRNWPSLALAQLWPERSPRRGVSEPGSRR